MARIVYGALVTEIKGSIGGTTFQSNRYGFTVKNKPNMVRPNKQKQTDQNLIFKAAVKRWNPMGQTGRDNWDQFAIDFPQESKHNPGVNLTGYAAFVRWHTARFTAQGPTADTESIPITSLPALDIDTITLETGVGNVDMVEDWNLGTDTWLVNYFISPPLQETQLFVGSNLRFFFSATNVDRTTNITPLLNGLFGIIPAAGMIFNLTYQLYSMNGGVVLAPVPLRLVVS